MAASATAVATAPRPSPAGEAAEDEEVNSRRYAREMMNLSVELDMGSLEEEVHLQVCRDLTDFCWARQIFQVATWSSAWAVRQSGEIH
jgi:hypothetical protein